MTWTDKINQVWQGDCLDLMKEMPDKSIDLVLTDPPYGINAGKEKEHNGWKDYGFNTWDERKPSKEIFDEIFRVSKNQIIWGGNYFIENLKPSMGWLVWDKGQRGFSLADGELAWTSFNRALRIHTVARGKALQDGKQHPTQKSLEIIKWCIAYAERALGRPVELIFDPFMGSWTTARACMDLGRNFVGAELSPEYCEIGRNRLKQQVLI